MYRAVSIFILTFVLCSLRASAQLLDPSNFQGLSCASALTQDSDESKAFEYIADEVYALGQQGKVISDPFIASQMLSLAKRVLKIHGTQVTPISRYTDIGFIINPESSGSNFNHFAKAVYDAVGLSLIYVPSKHLMKPRQGASMAGRDLYLPHHLLINPGFDRTDTVLVGITIGQVMHEIHHAFLKSLLQQGTITQYAGDVTSHSDDRPLSTIDLSIYNHRFSLEELSTYPLHLWKWAQLLSQIPPRQRPALITKFKSHVSLVLRFHQVILEALGGPDGTGAIRVGDYVIQDHKPGSHYYSAYGVFSNARFTYHLPRIFSSRTEYNWRSSQLVKLSQSVIPTYEHLLHELENFQDGSQDKISKMTEQLRDWTSVQ